MSGFNLPPGCSVNDLPGNTPEDAAWEKLIDEMLESGLSAAEARARWKSQPGLVVELFCAKQACEWIAIRLKEPTGNDVQTGRGQLEARAAIIKTVLAELSKEVE